MFFFCLSLNVGYISNVNKCKCAHNVFFPSTKTNFDMIMQVTCNKSRAELSLVCECFLVNEVYVTTAKL